MANGNGNVTISMGTIAKAIQWVGSLTTIIVVLFGAYQWCNSLSGDVAKMAYFAESISENQRKTADALQKIIDENSARREEHKEMLSEMREHDIRTMTGGGK